MLGCAVIDQPERFKSAASVAAYIGLTPRRYQSGEVDYSGRISKSGDAMLRACLYEAAITLLSKVERFSALKGWGSDSPPEKASGKPRLQSPATSR